VQFSTRNLRFFIFKVLINYIFNLMQYKLRFICCFNSRSQGATETHQRKQGAASFGLRLKLRRRLPGVQAPPAPDASDAWRPLGQRVRLQQLGAKSHHPGRTHHQGGDVSGCHPLLAQSQLVSLLLAPLPPHSSTFPWNPGTLPVSQYFF